MDGSTQTMTKKIPPEANIELEGLMEVFNWLGIDDCLKARREALSLLQPRSVEAVGILLGGKLTIRVDFDPEKMT